jgi:hypothetical protein
MRRIKTMKQDTHNTEQVYVCDGWPATTENGHDRPAMPCGVLHQESTVAVRTTTVNGHVSRTMYCDQCGSEALRLCDEAMAVDQGRRVREDEEARAAWHGLTGE